MTGSKRRLVCWFRAGTQEEEDEVWHATSFLLKAVSGRSPAEVVSHTWCKANEMCPLWLVAQILNKAIGGLD